MIGLLTGIVLVATLVGAWYWLASLIYPEDGM